MAESQYDGPNASPVDAARPERRTDTASLVTGVIFVGVAIGWLLLAQGILHWEDLGWLLPFLLIGAGVLGIVSSLARRP